MKLIGGEMLTWSDDTPAHGPLLAHLLAALLPVGGRVLVAGPHDRALLGALTGAYVTCLVRSVPDAEALAGAGVDVLCGTLAKLTDTDRYDVVIALDGLDRLCSVEGPQLDWTESLHVLRRALRPGGSLLLSVENELGVHRLVDRSSVTSVRTDSAWSPLGEFDPAKPGNPARLTARLTSDGLPVSWLAAAWPLPTAPTLIATRTALDSPAGALVAAASAAVAVAYAGQPVLSDPRRLTAAAVRGGLGAELAASWLVLAHRAPAPANTPVLPPVLLGDGPHGPVQELSTDPDGRWVRRVTGAAGAVNAPVTREVSTLDGPVPAGRLVEELLLASCLRHDLPGTRRVLTGWYEWLTGLPGGHAFATFDNVVLDGGTFRLLDPSWDTTGPVEAPVAAVRALRRFAVVLLSGGYAHPWPVTHDVDELTTILAGAAGVDLGAGSAPAAVALDTDIAEALGTPEPVHPHAERESAEDVRRLREQLADATARARWYDSELDRRDRELRKARTQIALFSGSVGFRAAKLAMAVLRRGRRFAKRLRRKL